MSLCSSSRIQLALCFLVGIALWLPLHPRTLQCDPASNCPSWSSARLNKKCWIDPTCASPVDNGSNYSHWRGFLNTGDPLLWEGSEFESLSITNFLMFLGSIIVALVSIAVLVPVKVRHLFLAVIWFYYALELGRWIVGVIDLVDRTSAGATAMDYFLSFFHPVSFLVLAVLITPLAIIVKLGSLHRRF